MVIGTASFINFEEFFDWALTEGKCWPTKENIEADSAKAFYNLYEEKDYNHFMKRYTDNRYKLNQFREIYDYSMEYGVPFELIKTNQVFSVLRFSKNDYYIPTKFITPYLWQDYSNTPLYEIRGIADTSDLSNNGKMYLSKVKETATVVSIQTAIKKKELEMEKENASINSMKEEMQAELERIKLEVEAKYRNMMAEKEAAAAKMSEMIKQMENELFLMDTEIYGIRCFLGETIQFTKLREGKTAPVDEPVILFQRLRFLDEELGKLISLYEVGEYDIPMFEKYIQTCDYASDHFAPGPKSISLVKLTKNSKGYFSTEKTANTLQKYDIFHGHRIGILIRNGENLYIGWTDCDMINITDENIFFRPGKTENEVNNSDDITKKTDKVEIASRYFVFSILEGVLSSGKILRIPQKESFFHGGGKYVIFSMADGYIEDTRFGLFSDIMKRCNINHQKGDRILCVQSLAAVQPKHYSRYSNDRGRGQLNRTHDVSAHNNTIYAINIVEKEEYPVVEYKSKRLLKRKGEDEYYNATTIRGTLDQVSDRLNDDVIILGQKNQIEYHCFISLHKDSSKKARANFELYEDEYINLTFLNSVWLIYAIQNQKIGKWYIGGQEVSYAYSVRYLNKALEHIREREKKESALISKYIKLPNEWQIVLSEWKIDKNVHEVTDYQAKRFARYLVDVSGTNLDPL